MAKTEKTPLDKKEYVSRFSLRGAAVIGDTSFTIDAHSEKSDWVYNRMSLGVNCGVENGTVYTQLMGGYGINRDNVVWVHGKTEEGKDDFQNYYTIDWDDRNDPNIISDLGDACFIDIAIEKTTTGQLVHKKFLSEYDAISYIKETLVSGTEIAVSGNITYQEYNDQITMNKEIRKIIAVDPDEEKRHATITQTILVDRDTIGEKSEHGTYTLYGYVLEKMKSYKGRDLTTPSSKSGQYVPLRKMFEFAPNVQDEKLVKKMFGRFIPKKGVNQVTFTGEFIEGASIVKPTLDDIDEDLKELLELGLVTEESVLADCAGNSSRERRVVFKTIKMKPTKEGKNIPMIIEGKYTDEDIELDFIPVNEDEIPDGLDDSEDDEFAELFSN